MKNFKWYRRLLGGRWYLVANSNVLTLPDTWVREIPSGDQWFVKKIDCYDHTWEYEEGNQRRKCACGRIEEYRLVDLGRNKMWLQVSQ